MKAKAMNQTQLNTRQSEVQVEYETIQHKVADLEAKQSELLQTLYRFNVHRSFMGTHPVPDYAPWLPFSD